MRKWQSVCNRAMRVACALVVGLLCAPFMTADLLAEPRPATAYDGLSGGLQAARVTDYSRAERELSSVHGVDQAAAEVVLARVLLEQGRFADAERAAVLAAANPNQNAEATAVRARILSAQGKTKEAVRLLEPLQNTKGRPGRIVRLSLGELLIASGRLRDAEAPLLEIVDEYNSDAIKSPDAEGLAMVGRAAFLLRSPKDANRAFNEAERIDKRAVQMLLWRAELFFDNYDPGDAEEALKEALAIAPNRADGLVLEARLKLDQTLDFNGAEEALRQADAIDPNLSSAYAVRASMAIRDMDLEASEAAIRAGLAINPNDTELWALRAASRFLADDRAGYEAAKKETFARNPEFARFYEIVSDFAEWEHRYSDIVTMMKQAVSLDARDGKAYAELGLTELRNGDETDGLDSLRKARALDHYNVRVYNTLNLYEQVIPNDYESMRGSVFSIRYPKAEKKVLERYVPQLLAEAWGSMKSRYDFVPATPVAVELYATRNQFSVRTSGLPNVGIQGVCFGQVLAAMSPSAEPFNWGNVLWHELGHVFAIQLSKSHVPRWFTEGLSEYETIVRRPEWQRELDPELYLAIVGRRLPGAIEMNRAFTHADNGEDMTVAYYAASQMLVFTAEQFGMPRIVRALKLWGEGGSTSSVLLHAFGIPPEEYDTKYRSWQLQRLARYSSQFVFDDHPIALEEAKAKAVASPNDAKAHTAYALSLLHSNKADPARQEIDLALGLDSKELSAHYISFKLAESSHDSNGMRIHVEAMLQAGGDGYALQMAIAELAKASQNNIALRSALETAARFDATQAEPLRELLKLAREEKRDNDALDLLRRLTRLEQHDRRAWREFLDRLVVAKKWEEAAAVGESAIFVDVESAPIHMSYARALSALGKHNKAEFELESALLCDASSKETGEAHALLAIEFLALRNSAAARSHRDEALRIDPENPEARALVVP
jgi:cellulose synthase operon protein C